MFGEYNTKKRIQEVRKQFENIIQNKKQETVLSKENKTQQNLQKNLENDNRKNEEYKKKSKRLKEKELCLKNKQRKILEEQ